MHYKEVDKVLKEYARNIPDLSKRIGASIPAIYKWKQRDRIPKKYQAMVKKVIEYYKTTNPVTVKSLIYKLGGVKYVAKVLKISIPRVYWWIHSNKIPKEYESMVKSLAKESYRRFLLDIDGHLDGRENEQGSGRYLQNNSQDSIEE